LNGGVHVWSIREPSQHAHEPPYDRPWHGAPLLHGGRLLRVRDVLLPFYVRRVSSITSVKRHLLLPRPYTGSMQEKSSSR
jgi:hypothetical protein